jgi:hypothetical protein
VLSEIVSQGRLPPLPGSLATTCLYTIANDTCVLLLQRVQVLCAHVRQRAREVLSRE